MSICCQRSVLQRTVAGNFILKIPKQVEFDFFPTRWSAAGFKLTVISNGLVVSYKDGILSGNKQAACSDIFTRSLPSYYLESTELSPLGNKRKKIPWNILFKNLAFVLHFLQGAVACVATRDRIMDKGKVDSKKEPEFVPCCLSLCLPSHSSPTIQTNL